MFCFSRQRFQYNMKYVIQTLIQILNVKLSTLQENTQSKPTLKILFTHMHNLTFFFFTKPYNNNNNIYIVLILYYMKIHNRSLFLKIAFTH